MTVTGYGGRAPHVKPEPVVCAGAVRGLPGRAPGRCPRLEKQQLPFFFLSITMQIPINNHRNAMNLETFTKMRALESAYTSYNSRLLDDVLRGDQAEEVRGALKLKRIQFDASSELFERLETTCTALNCSKREFLEMAVTDAIEMAQRVYSETYRAETGE